MLSQIKRIFFNGMFGILYAAFTYVCAMTIYGVISGAHGFEMLGTLPFVWLALIAARYLSKRSAGLGHGHEGGYYGGNHGGNHNSGTHGGNHYRR